jgi:16S rRNA (cytosine967-C5)-methyltransferase
MRVVHATGVQPGDRVLDLCAGPGGKATHLARWSARRARHGVELHPHRAELIRQAAARQGVEVDVRSSATRRPAAGDDETVRRGAARRAVHGARHRPPPAEVRWRRTPRTSPSWPSSSAAARAAADAGGAPGGQLDLRGVHLDATRDRRGRGRVRRDRPDGLRLRAGADALQLLPDVDDTDGMFIATWQRPAVGGVAD